MTRPPERCSPGSSRRACSSIASAPGSDVHFRIHPLLLEVVRRRLNAGGVDIQQAHGTVLRAARLDLARGDTTVAFRRMVTLGEYDEAADVLAQHGPQLLSHGSAELIEKTVRRAGATLEKRPDTWTALGVAAWLCGHPDVAAHWAERVVRHESDEIPAAQVALVRLLRSRTGAEPVPGAVDAARAQLDNDDDPFLPLLLTELGAAEVWLCDLAAAEQHLDRSVLLSRSQSLDPWTQCALSHLAITMFMTGRERPAHDLAVDVIATSNEAMVRVPGTGERAQITRQLVELQSLSWDEDPDPTPTTGVDDLAGRHLSRVLSARLALRRGSLTDAQRVLEEPLDTPPLPRDLQIQLEFERALHALFAGDREVLRHCADALGALDAAAEQTWVNGTLADLEGDLRAAATLYARAAETATRAQPTTEAMALACAAQVHDYLGDRDTAATMLAEAIAVTQSRGLAAPFLGWSTNGTRVGALLSKTPDVETSSWGSALLEACADRPAIASIFRPLVASQRELDSAVQLAVTPSLSPRENEVLGELARGSTYSDIAATLFVSENTVKTHISSLYAKLSVSRRSEALAVARTMHLL